MKAIIAWLLADPRRSISMDMSGGSTLVELRVFEDPPSSQMHAHDNRVILLMAEVTPFLAVGGQGETPEAAFKDAPKTLAEHFK